MYNLSVHTENGILWACWWACWDHGETIKKCPPPPPPTCHNENRSSITMFTRKHRKVFGGILKSRILTYTPNSQSRILLKKLLKFPAFKATRRSSSQRDHCRAGSLKPVTLLTYVRICSSFNSVVRNSFNTVTNSLSTVSNDYSLETTCREKPMENT